MTQLDINTGVKTGNLAVDMCIACILHYHQAQSPIKTIMLSNGYFAVFSLWVMENHGVDTLKKDMFIAGVQIKREVIPTGKILSVEYEKKLKTIQA